MANSIKASLVGVDDAIHRTQELLDRMKSDDARLAIGPAGKILRDRARQLAPYDSGREKGTHLRDAIFYDTREHGKGATILFGVNYTKAPHAHLWEFGWSQKPGGQPFLRPAVSEKRSEVMNAIAKGIQRIAMGFGKYSGG
ncbi:MAG: hypothetical protein A2Z18_11025 [Armatimonadetes bacterium RBG_16_58_9]|nr:MAG: hypothetical protein A2Z18_11025 [Armatimonadetes bacterium RBG_16_58_9]